MKKPIYHIEGSAEHNGKKIEHSENIEAPSKQDAKEYFSKRMKVAAVQSAAVQRAQEDPEVIELFTKVLKRERELLLKDATVSVEKIHRLKGSKEKLARHQIEAVKLQKAADEEE